MIRRISSRILSATPSLLVAGFFGAAFVRAATPKSLIEALGSTGTVWIVALILAHLVAGILELILNPRHPSIRVLRTGIAVHIICAVTLAGYAVGLIFGVSTPLYTIGLALAAATLHLSKWRQIVSQDIPLAELIHQQQNGQE